MNFKQPLEIYVLWHPDYEEGLVYANKLFTLFCRNFEQPFDSTLNIPLYFRFEKSSAGIPIPINLDEAQRTAVIVLIDDNFVLDENYHAYLQELIDAESTNSNKVRIYPIAFSANFHKVCGTLNSKNAIRAYDLNLLDNLSQTSEELIKTSLLHEIARLLLNLTKGTEKQHELTSTQPIRLFISHSKHDKQVVAEAWKFKNFVDSRSQLKSFFDVNDIGYGANFEAEIKKGITESALVVFQSDSYASREWCRIEAIIAKANNCPVIVVNAIEMGERRSFPYLGNVPTIRLNENYQAIIDLTLEKVVFNLYQKELMNEVAKLYKIDINYKTSTFPELFDIINIKKKMSEDKKSFSLILYPDPPVGSEELKLLNEMDSNLFFVTPTQLATLEILNNAK